MVECGGLEIRYPGNRIQGSNPCLSARQKNPAGLGSFVWLNKKGFEWGKYENRKVFITGEERFACENAWRTCGSSGASKVGFIRLLPSDMRFPVSPPRLKHPALLGALVCYPRGIRTEGHRKQIVLRKGFFCLLPNRETAAEFIREVGWSISEYRHTSRPFSDKVDQWIWRNEVCYQMVQGNVTNLIVVKSMELADFSRQQFMEVWEKA